jgi:predicted MFS family arabinose efflux permease
MTLQRDTAPAQREWVWDARRIVQLGVLTFARLCTNTLRRIVYPFAPAFARGLGAPVDSIYLMISLQNMIGLFSPLFVPLPERYGRRNVMAVGLLVVGAIALLVVVWPSIWTLGLALITAGAVKVIYDPAMQSYLGDTVPYAQRGKALSVTEFAWSGAFLLGAPLTGWLIARQGWPAPFLWLGLAGLLASVLLWRALPSAHKGRRSSAGLSYIWRTLRRHPVIWAAALYMTLALVAQETLFIVYGDWMESTFNLNLTSLGFATVLIGLAEIGGEASAGWSVDRFGKRPVVILCGLLSAAVFLIIPFTTGALMSAMAALFALFFTFEIAIVGAIPLLTELVPGARGVVMAMSLGAMSAGRVIGSLAGPVVWERFGVAGNSTVSAAVMVLAVLVLARWLHEGVEESS